MALSFQNIIDEVEKLAHTAASVIPQADLVDEGAQILEGIVHLIQGVKDSAPADTSTAQLDEARQVLEASIVPKSEQLSKDLRGE